MTGKPITLEVLTSPGCVHCHAFLRFWHEIEKDWPNVTLTERSIMSPEGQDLVQKFMIFAAPGIVLNNQLFATGGVDQKTFLEKIKELSQ